MPSLDECASSSHSVRFLTPLVASVGCPNDLEADRKLITLERVQNSRPIVKRGYCTLQMVTVCYSTISSRKDSWKPKPYSFIPAYPILDVGLSNVASIIMDNSRRQLLLSATAHKSAKLASLFKNHLLHAQLTGSQALVHRVS